MMNRRAFLWTAAGALAAPAPVIDTHIHLFDTSRPQGVPWPDKKNAVLYRPALPDRYRQIAVPLGVKGAVVIEASPWFDDNQWVLDIAAKEPIIVGTIGNLEPGGAEFGKQLERFHRNPLFRGIRYGNLWDRVLGTQLRRDEFLTGLKLLSQANLTLDTANPDMDLIGAVVKVTDLVPGLRVVIDHLPQMGIPAEPAVAQKYRAELRELAGRPQVYVKLSQIFQRAGDAVPRDLGRYRATLDEIYGFFGEDRVLYGSDWPNCDLWRPYPDVLGLVQQYFADKGPTATEKYFWRNSVSAYRWVKRESGQPG